MANDNFIWGNFGVLKEVRREDGNLLIVSESGHFLKMSSKYDLERMEKKIRDNQMIGKKTIARTSQNTDHWSEVSWFSDLMVGSIHSSL